MANSKAGIRRNSMIAASKNNPYGVLVPDMVLSWLIIDSRILDGIKLPGQTILYGVLRTLRIELRFPGRTAWSSWG